MALFPLSVIIRMVEYLQLSILSRKDAGILS